MKKIFFIFTLISAQAMAQYLYFGIPEDKQIPRINSKDIIILNEIHWWNGPLQFTDTGIQQLEKLSLFLSETKAKAIEIKLYAFHSGNRDYNQKVTEKVGDKIYKFLIEKDNSLEGRLSVKPCGDSIALFCENNESFPFWMNTRIEVRITR